MEYKGFIIEKETDQWALKFGGHIRFYRDENIFHAKTIDEAKAEIDEKTCNDESIED